MTLRYVRTALLRMNIRNSVKYTFSLLLLFPLALNAMQGESNDQITPVTQTSNAPTQKLNHLYVKLTLMDYHYRNREPHDTAATFWSRRYTFSQEQQQLTPINSVNFLTIENSSIDAHRVTLDQDRKLSISCMVNKITQVNASVDFNTKSLTKLNDLDSLEITAELTIFDNNRY